LQEKEIPLEKFASNRSRLLKKLNLRKNAELPCFAMQNRLIEL